MKKRSRIVLSLILLLFPNGIKFHAAIYNIYIKISANRTTFIDIPVLKNITFPGRQFRFCQQISIHTHLTRHVTAAVCVKNECLFYSIPNSRWNDMTSPFQIH